MPKFSIIIPCHNAASYVGAAIQSSVVQTERDLEVIVVDDGSTDESAAIVSAVARADPRVRLLRQSNQGVGAARNAGLAVAQGELVTFLDADDLLEPQKLAVQGAVLMENPGIGLVLCDGSVIDRDGNMLWDGLVDARHFAGHPPLFEVCFRGGPFPPLVPMVRRELAVAAGGFDPDPAAAGWADIDFWMRVALAGTDYHFVAARLVRYRQTPTSMSADRERMQHAARFVYTKWMRERPLDSACALRAAQARLRDLEFAMEQMRTVIGSLAGERDAVADERNRLVREQEGLALATGAVSQSRLAAWTTVIALLGNARSAGRPLMIWGAGAAGRRLLALFRRAGCSAEAFVDSEKTKDGTEVEGLPVVAPSVLADPDRARPYVLVASIHAAEITPRLRALGWRQGADYHVADFDVDAIDSIN